MKCQVDGCGATRFYEGGMFSTSMGVERYVEGDDHHVHDPNSVSTQWTCSNGHRFGESRKNECPVSGCKWNDRGRVLDPIVPKQENGPESEALSR